ncbi:hypothetical protein [Streptomyces collinus]
MAIVQGCGVQREPVGKRVTARIDFLDGPCGDFARRNRIVRGGGGHLGLGVA